MRLGEQNPVPGHLISLSGDPPQVYNIRYQNKIIDHMW
jgi:hypothetical protein